MKAIVIIYAGNEVTETALAQVASILDNHNVAKIENIKVSTLDDAEVAKLFVSSATSKSTKITFEENKSPIDNALLYIGTRYADIVEDPIRLTIKLTNDIKDETDKSLRNALKIISETNLISANLYRKYHVNKPVIEVCKHIHRYYMA